MLDSHGQLLRTRVFASRLVIRLTEIVVAIAISLFAAPIVAQDKPAGKVWRIGILQTSGPRDEAGRMAALEQGLAELGYFGGRNIVLVNRNAGQQMGRLPEFAAELVRALPAAGYNPAKCLLVAGHRTTKAAIESHLTRLPKLLAA